MNKVYTPASLQHTWPWYWTAVLWSIDTCQNKISANHYHVTISCTQGRADQVLVFDWVAGSRQVNLLRKRGLIFRALSVPGRCYTAILRQLRQRLRERGFTSIRFHDFHGTVFPRKSKSWCYKRALHYVVNSPFWKFRAKIVTVFKSILFVFRWKTVWKKQFLHFSRFKSRFDIHAILQVKHRRDINWNLSVHF